jgi:hypothetical protein
MASDPETSNWCSPKYQSVNERFHAERTREVQPKHRLVDYNVPQLCEILWVKGKVAYKEN